MKDLATAYIEYLTKLKQIKKPKMPTFDIETYNDNDYILASKEITENFGKIDDFDVYENFIKGE